MLLPLCRRPCRHAAGPTLHTARWDFGVSLEGKRVAVIGTGASAAQLVPAIASIAREVTVFQRTPAWVVPRRDRAIPGLQVALFTLLPPLMWLYRALLFLLLEINFWAIIKRGTCLRRIATWVSRRHLARQVRDPAVREALTPRYEMGCKRVILSDDYWAAFNRGNVHLVTEGIARVTRGGIATKDGAERPFDVLVYATGFDVVGSVAALNVRGIGGVPFQKAMLEEGAQTYLGITVSGA